MVVIWGLDLREMKWNKFKGSYMWNNTYHQRKRRFGVFQLAMAFCVVSESLGTDLISRYLDERDRVVAYNPALDQFSTSDLNGAFSYNIFVGIYVATIFGACFFFDLFWPERKESPAVRLAWKICSILTIPLTLSSAILLTVIVATHHAWFKGEYIGEIDPPFEYRLGARAIASVVLIWLGFLSSIWATYLLVHNINHTQRHGPFSTRAREQLHKQGYEDLADTAAGSLNPGYKALMGQGPIRTQEKRGTATSHEGLVSSQPGMATTTNGAPVVGHGHGQGVHQGHGIEHGHGQSGQPTSVRETSTSVTVYL